MERELWPTIYRLLRDEGADFSQKSVQYQPWLIVAVLFWAALHDRPRYWACDPRNWATTTLRPAALPSPSAVSRRSRSLAVGWLMRAVEDRLRRAAEPTLVSCLDGKPLPVGSRSSDPDARPKGPFGPGYKLHAIWAGQPAPATWEVTAAGVGEAPVGERLVGRLDSGGYLVADGNYDSSPLFDAAARSGYQLVVDHWRPNAGAGHRRVSPHRLRSIALRPTAFGRALYAVRGGIERCFGNAVGFAGGLGPLPAWVRCWHRVYCWVSAKLTINAVRIVRKQGLMAAMQ
jgi:Transposase DDE domain